MNYARWARSGWGDDSVPLWDSILLPPAQIQLRGRFFIKRGDYLKRGGEPGDCLPDALAVHAAEKGRMILLDIETAPSVDKVNNPRKEPLFACVG
jgi:hypothetical protein